MLRFAKKDVRSIYTVEDDGGRVITPLRSTGSWAAASITVDGDELEIGASDRGETEIRRAGQTIAAASSERSVRFRISFDGGELVLEHASGKRYDAGIGGATVGSIALAGWAGRRVEVDLPDVVPVDVQILAAFVLLRVWNRQATA